MKKRASEIRYVKWQVRVEKSEHCNGGIEKGREERKKDSW